jgi:putative DNA primase/helicase
MSVDGREFLYIHFGIASADNQAGVRTTTRTQKADHFGPITTRSSGWTAPVLFLQTNHLKGEPHSMTEDIYLPIVHDYIAQSFSPVPIPFKTKNPMEPKWTSLRITEENVRDYFGSFPSNVGILLGDASGGLVDIDVDDPDALAFVPQFLPPTACVFGRASKPRSHWVYRCPDAKRREFFQANGMILELRGNGAVTVFPGSVHPTGEEVVFDNPEALTPGNSTWKELRKAAVKIALATVLFKSWSGSTRHDLTLAISGYLAQQQPWTVEEVTDLITAVASKAGDTELRDRLTCIQTTFERAEAGESVLGLKGLVPILGEATTSMIRKWFGSSSLKKHSKKPELVDIMTDAGAADAFSAAYGGQLIYSNKQWYQKQKQVFVPIGEEIVQGIAKEFLQKQLGGVSSFMGGPPKACLSRGRTNATVELSRKPLHVGPELIDGNKDVIGLPDGSLLKIGRDGIGITRDQSSIVTKRLGATFTQNASCPLWLNFLDRIFEGRTDVIRFIQRAVGYSLTASVEEQCLFILIGGGANGKSTFLGTLHHLFGEYATTIPMQSLMVQINGDKQGHDLASLVGKRFVSASEGEIGQKLAESKIKLMTGKDPISCRGLYKDFTVLYPQFKLWLMTNNLPTISGADEAIWRRIMVIPFNVTIPAAERDKTLQEKLVATELPGILNWAVEGLEGWYREGLNPPARVLQSTRNYRSEHDSVGQWIDGNCNQAPNLHSSMKDLYRSYQEFCENSALEAMPNTTFGKELTRRGFASVRHRNGNARRGLALKPDELPSGSSRSKRRAFAVG